MYSTSIFSLPLPKPILWLGAIQIIFDSSPNTGRNVFRQGIEGKEFDGFDLPIFGCPESKISTNEDGDMICAQLEEVGVNAEEFQIAERGADFLQCFTAGGIGEGFFAFCSAAGEVPLVLVGVFDEQDFIVADEHDPHADGDRFENAQQTDEDEVEGFEKGSFHGV